MSESLSWRGRSDSSLGPRIVNVAQELLPCRSPYSFLLPKSW
ncbi:MAG: hypothetical protein WD875_02450 [Pirellulales bacterium]